MASAFNLLCRIKAPCFKKRKRNTNPRIDRKNEKRPYFGRIVNHCNVEKNSDKTVDNHQHGIFNKSKHCQEIDN